MSSVEDRTRKELAMKRIIIVLAVAFSAIAVGQSPFTLTEPEITVDEFTGETSCSVWVSNSRSDFSSISLTVVDGHLSHVGLIRRASSTDDLAFSTVGELDATVFLRFSEDDIQRLNDVPAVSQFGSGVYYDGADISDEGIELLNKILSHNDDLRLRFEGSRRTRDFTINHEVIEEVARGFREVCLPLLEDE